MGDTMRLTILLTTTLLLMLTLTVSAAPAPNPAFDKLHGIYISTIASYKAECNKSVIETPKVYIKSLIQLRSQLQQVGDLDGWEKVGEELKRFQSEPKVTPEQLDTSTGELNSLQRQHVKRRDEFQHVKHQKVLALMEMYVGRLNTMQVKLTKAGDFDGAFAIKKEIARVNGAPEIVEAEFAMAASRAKAAPPPPQAANHTPAPGAAAPAAEELELAAAPTEIEEKSDGTRLYPPGGRPPRDSAIVYKRVTLSRTSNTPLGGPITVAFWEGSQKKRTSSSSSYYGTSKSTTEARQARLTLRTSKSGQTSRDMRVDVQYYARSAATSASRNKPILLATKRVDVPYLDTRNVTIDLAPVSLSQRSYRSSSRYRSSTRSSSGSKFYGCVVTVSDKQGKILMQGVSVSQLKELAPDGHTLAKAAAKDQQARRMRDLSSEMSIARNAYYADVNNQDLRAAYFESRSRYTAAAAQPK